VSAFLPTAVRFSRQQGSPGVSFSAGLTPNIRYCKGVVLLVYLEAVLALPYEISLPCTVWDPVW